MSNGSNLVLGATNTATNETNLYITPTEADADALYVQSDSGNCIGTYTDDGWGVFGSGEGGGGVYGGTKAGVGVRAYSNDNYGIISEGTAVGAYASNLESGTSAYLGAGSVAGDFYGGVYIHGDLTVSGHKSAAVAHADGSTRRVYSVESPEMWFEDFGKGKLINGGADVAIDPDFASLVNREDYHVFLTEYGDSEGLFVYSQSPDGFQVRERHDGKSDISFGYRVVARRIDVPGLRLDVVDVPAPVPVPPRPEAPAAKPSGIQ